MYGILLRHPFLCCSSCVQWVVWFLIRLMWTSLSVRELNTAYSTRQIFWVAKSYTAFHCTYSLSTAIFLNIDISQGNVATWLRRGKIFKYDSIANLLLSVTVKEFWKSVNIWQIYVQDYGILFFDSQCTGTFRDITQIKKSNAMKNITNLGLKYWHADKMFPHKRLNLTWMKTQTMKWIFW